MPEQTNSGSPKKIGHSYAEFQFKVYQQGTEGKLSPLPFDRLSLEQRAKEKLDPKAYSFIAGDAGEGITSSNNREAFNKWSIVQRMLRDVSQRDLSVNILGTQLSTPFLLAPIGVQRLAHPEGELAVARAAASLNTGMILSTVASFSLEKVADELGSTPRWFQLYFPKVDDMAISLLARAERAGYTAVVITVDTGMMGWRPQNLNTAYSPFFYGEGWGNYFSDPVFRKMLTKSPEEDITAASTKASEVVINAAATWDIIPFIRKHTRLPILIKGIVHPDDAKEAIRLGVDGIVVSNHGGRQVDGCIGSLDALIGVVAAVPKDYPILFDSGIRTGVDAFKAIALGARAVLIGRPYIWGLALQGEEGVRHVISSFLTELDVTCAMSGYPSIRELNRDALINISSK